jgi:hypothetical protein
MPQIYDIGPTARLTYQVENILNIEFNVEIKQEENSGDKCGNTHSNVKWYTEMEKKMLTSP